MAAELDVAPDEEAEKKRRMQLQLGGYGMGVPLSRHYAKFFGGDLHFSSVYGFGTDVSIRLNRLFSIEERQEADSMSSISEVDLRPGASSASPVKSGDPHLRNTIFDFELGTDPDPDDEDQEPLRRSIELD